MFSREAVSGEDLAWPIHHHFLISWNSASSSTVLFRGRYPWPFVLVRNPCLWTFTWSVQCCSTHYHWAALTFWRQVQKDDCSEILWKPFSFSYCSCTTNKQNVLPKIHHSWARVTVFWGPPQYFFANIKIQESIISHQGKLLPAFGDTIFSIELLRNRPTLFQKHCERIADFLLPGENHWWSFDGKQHIMFLMVHLVQTLVVNLCCNISIWQHQRSKIHFYRRQMHWRATVWKITTSCLESETVRRWKTYQSFEKWR